MKKFFKIVAFVLSIYIASSVDVLAEASSVVTLGSYDLVDSGKHLDWDGNTNYMVQFTYAVNTWNSYKPGVIRRDTIRTIQDVSVSDYEGDNSSIATVYSSGKIKFNQVVMDTQNDNQKKKACLFALGIALGLGSTNKKCDVMYTYSSSVTTLSTNDKASYDAAYKKY